MHMCLPSRSPALRRNGENDDAECVENESHQHDDTALRQRVRRFHRSLKKNGRGAVKPDSNHNRER